ncbi:MAG: hypothetical protein HC822_01170 [Oscillochloris sp.]|nr:hypothetical protein [Oscillochloris sp.]
MFVSENQVVHVRFNGRSEQLDFAALDLTPDAGDAELRAAIAQRYQCELRTLDEYVIVREPQAIIIRPIAYYG